MKRAFIRRAFVVASTTGPPFPVPRQSSSANNTRIPNHRIGLSPVSPPSSNSAPTRGKLPLTRDFSPLTSEVTYVKKKRMWLVVELGEMDLASVATKLRSEVSLADLVSEAEARAEIRKHEREQAACKPRAARRHS
jgi:hypothetical protein